MAYMRGSSMKFFRVTAAPPCSSPTSSLGLRTPSHRWGNSDSCHFKPKLLEPLPLEEAKTKVIGAKRFAQACASYSPLLVGQPMFSEDCLYLNIFTPSRQQKMSLENLRNTSTAGEGYPVVVWIHGGAFAGGNAHTYGYEVLSHNFVTRGIVVVTIQFRLGMFGLFSKGDQVMPGNLALWDKRAALIWIQENILHFGGDPNRVTLWGQNSGSAAVGALSVSKRTRGLFNQSIEMSGSMFAGWATSNSAVATSRRIAKLLNCPVKGSKKVKTCLKEATTEEIAKAGEKLGWRRDDVNHVRMQMRMDGDFFDDKDFETMIHDAPPKPTILGFTSQDSMLLTIPFTTSPQNSSLIIPQSEWENFNRERLAEFVKKTVVPEELFGKNETTIHELRQAITCYADRNQTANPDYKFYLTRYTQILSDIQYTVPSLMEVLKKSREEWPVFLYLLNYMNPKFGQLPVQGTFQTYEFPYLFGVSFVGPVEFNEDDKRLQDVMISSLANFIKSGNPSTSYGIWPRVNAEHPFGFFDMSPRPVLRDNLMLDRFLFWTALMDEHREFNLIRD